MKNILLFALAVLPLFSGTVIAQNNPTHPPLYAVDVYNDSLRVYDTTDFTTQYSMNYQLVDTSVAALDITGANGLAVHPCTGEFYIILKINGQSGRSLGTVDVNSGICQIIGNTGENIAGIAFLNDTTLLGISGDGGNMSEMMYSIDMNTAAITSIFSDPSGSDGETIATCWDNGAIYRFSGRNTDNVQQKWSIGAIPSITNVPITGFDWDETFGATYIGNGEFLLTNLDQEFVIADTSGFAVNTGFATAQYNKGIAFPSRYVWFASATPDSICPFGDSMQLVATAGADAYQWYHNGTAIAGATNDTLMAQSPGDYSCEITKSTCTLFSDNTITVNALPYDTAVVVPAAGEFCEGDSVMLAGNNTGTMTEWWNGGTQLNSDTSYTATTGGTYTYMVYSANGCYDMIDVVVTENPNPIVTLTGTDEMLGNDGAIDLTIVGGIGLTFDWDNDGTGDFNDTEDLSGLTAGTYTVVVMAPTGCSTTETITIGSQVGLEEFGKGADLLIYPNPNDGVFTVELVNMNVENMSLQITNTAGQVVMKSGFDSNTLPVDIRSFGAGIYNIVLSNGTNTTVQQIIVK